MRDAPYNKQRARIRALCSRWQRLLLPSWTITYHYCDDREGMPKDTSSATLGACVARWEYLGAAVYFYMPEIEETTDDYLECVFVHELAHCLVSEMRTKGLDHEERTVTELTAAILRVREARKRGEQMQHGAHKPMMKHPKTMPKGHSSKKGAKKGKRK